MKIALLAVAARGVALVLSLSMIMPQVPGQETSSPSTNSANRSASRFKTNDPIARIRDEGLNRSQVMQTLSYLTEVIGPRLTGSPNLKRANEWTRDKLTSWGLTNAHLEPWGPFGRGWSLTRFSAQIVEPQFIPLIAAPKAWTPGFEKPLTAEVVYLDAKTDSDLEKHKGKLKGSIVLASPVREVRARFDAYASRMSESNLLRLANASPSEPRPLGNRPAETNATPLTNVASTTFFGRTAARATSVSDTQPVSTNATNIARADGSPSRRAGAFGNSFQTRVLSFLAKEEAALVVTPSSQGDGGTLFVAQASIPGRGTNATNSARGVWATNAPAIPAQISLAAEDYNRLVRAAQQGEKLKMAVDLEVQFHTNDFMAYNTIAEIPGGDLKNEVVMIGAHLDSWHSGTGATDNGAGVAATMEAVRILKALDLQPRRTIRIGLWTGEEQGLLGSKAYVTEHFGYYTNITNGTVLRSPRDESNASRRSRASSTNSPRRLVRQRDYEKLSAYYNLDNGTGKIRGVYMQGNEGVRPHFRKWLQPFYDLGAETLTAANTGGTDHLSFDAIGLPGFQFIQDPMDYFTRTHHSNADVYDRIQADDMKQAATIMAAFLYQTAMLDEKLPRKAVD